MHGEKMTVYIDVIFLENLIINYIILYATSIIAKVKIKQYRVLLGSAIGAIYSVIYYVVNLEWFVLAGVKIVLSIVIIYISFNSKDFKNLIKQVIFFYLISFIFAGASLAVIYMVNSNNISIQNGAIIGEYTLRTILIGIIISFFIMMAALKFIKKRQNIYCNIRIKLNNQEIITNAMIDTGNFLKEPITNIPVVVVEDTLLYEIIPKEILNNIDKILGGDFESVPEKVKNEYISRLKVIPFSSLGKQNGMLLGIRADEIEIEQEDEVRNINKVTIGIYDKSLTKRGEYRALVGLDLIN